MPSDDGQDTTNPKDIPGEGKPQLHLIPPSAEILESAVLAIGAQKYGPFLWRQAGAKAKVYISAAKRHLAQWFDGEDNDSESGVSHLAHVRACMGILIDAQTGGNMEDDRPTRGQASALIEKYTVCDGGGTSVLADDDIDLRHVPVVNVADDPDS